MGDLDAPPKMLSTPLTSAKPVHNPQTKQDKKLPDIAVEL
jgi:hypothetical protein